MRRLRVRPDTLTLASLGMAVAAAVSFAEGYLAVGGLAFLASGLLDTLDGRLARATGTASARGAFLDSICDRYAELAVFGGLAVHLGAGLPFVIVLAALTGGLMTSYARARGEGLGVRLAEVGLVQRPVRILLVGVPALLGEQPLLIALGLLAAMGNATALTRIRHVRRALPAPVEPASPVVRAPSALHSSPPL